MRYVLLIVHKYAAVSSFAAIIPPMRWSSYTLNLRSSKTWGGGFFCWHPSHSSLMMFLFLLSGHHPQKQRQPACRQQHMLFWAQLFSSEGFKKKVNE